MKIIVSKNDNDILCYLQNISKDVSNEMYIDNIDSYAKKLSQYAKVLFLVKENQNIGMLAYYDNNKVDKIGYISSFSIIKDFQQQGYGEILMTYVITKLTSSKTQLK